MSRLDAALTALADPTRRAILTRLRQGPCTISEIARPFPISLPAVSKHVRVLERAGLVEREVRGRSHLCRFNAEPLRRVHSLTGEYLQWWESRLDALDAMLRRDGPQRGARESGR